MKKKEYRKLNAALVAHNEELMLQVKNLELAALDWAAAADAAVIDEIDTALQLIDPQAWRERVLRPQAKINPCHTEDTEGNPLKLIYHPQDCPYEYDN